MIFIGNKQMKSQDKKHIHRWEQHVSLNTFLDAVFNQRFQFISFLFILYFSITLTRLLSIARARAHARAHTHTLTLTHTHTHTPPKQTTTNMPSE